MFGVDKIFGGTRTMLRHHGTLIPTPKVHGDTAYSSKLWMVVPSEIYKGK